MQGAEREKILSQEEKICYHCFAVYDAAFSLCPVCGGKEVQNQAFCLQPGSLLRRRFLVGNTEWAGSTEIIYRGYDRICEKRVWIKELFLRDAMERGENGDVVKKERAEGFSQEAAVERYYTEGMRYAAAGGVPRVYTVFEEHHTAYFVVDDGKEIGYIQKVKEINPMLFLEQNRDVPDPGADWELRMRESEKKEKKRRAAKAGLAVLSLLVLAAVLALAIALRT